MRATFSIGHEVGVNRHACRGIEADAFSGEPSHGTDDAPDGQGLRVMGVLRALRLDRGREFALPSLTSCVSPQKSRNLEDLWRDIDRALSG
jgi:hypothetical protein